MARSKNAITGYFVKAWTPGMNASDIDLELADKILTVNNDQEEETEEKAYYDGDGTPKTEVTNMTYPRSFEGEYDPTDAAMKFIADREFDIQNRTIAFKEVRADGTVYYGKATVSGIKVTGGAAEDWAPFECTIAWDQKPTEVPAPTEEPTEEPTTDPE